MPTKWSTFWVPFGGGEPLSRFHKMSFEAVQCPVHPNLNIPGFPHPKGEFVRFLGGMNFGPKIWGIFGGVPLPPTRGTTKVLNFGRSNLNLAVVRSSIPLPVGPEKIRKVLAWGAYPPKTKPQKFPKIFLGVGDPEY